MGNYTGAQWSIERSWRWSALGAATEGDNRLSEVVDLAVNLSKISETSPQAVTVGRILLLRLLPVQRRLWVVNSDGLSPVALEAGTPHASTSGSKASTTAHLHFPNVVVGDIKAPFDDAWNRKPKDCDAGKSNQKRDDGDDQRHEGNHTEYDADRNCDLFHGSRAPKEVLPT